MSLLDEADGRRIEETIARLEKRSAAELVVAVIPKSENYSERRALLAGLWAVASALAYFRFLGDEPIYLALELPIGLLAWVVLGVPALHRRLIPEKDAERAVEGAAYRIFAERGLHKTRDRTGILLLISELEHRVVLLGDEGIHARVGTEGWEKHVAHVVRRIREGRTVDGVLEVISELEEMLAEGVPAGSENPNELPNQIVRE